MKDLIDFNRFQIEALQAEICKLKQENNLLSTYCFEALEEVITQGLDILTSNFADTSVCFLAITEII